METRSDGDHLNSLREKGEKKTMTKEELKALGLSEEQIGGVFKINGLDIEKAKEGLATKEAELKLAKEQLDAANTQIKTFEGKDLDIEQVRKEAADYKDKAEKAEQDAKEKVATLTFENNLDKNILKKKGRNPVAIKALLDKEDLMKAEDQEAAIQAALDKLNEKETYLFETEEQPKPPAGPGGNLLGGERKKTNIPDEENYGATLGKKKTGQEQPNSMDQYKL